MIFKEVYYSNLDKLVNVFKDIQKNDNIGIKFFKQKDHYYFKTVKISYVLSGVSDLDIMIFKNLGANTTSSSYTVNLPKFSDEIPDISIIGEKVYNLYQNIENPDKDNLLPVSYKKRNCIVSFSGMSLINLLGINPMDTLKVNKDFTLPTYKVLSEILFKLLYDKFYTRMNSFLEETDLLADFSLQKQYYRYVNSKEVKINNGEYGKDFYRCLDIALASINTCVGSFSLINTNKTELTTNTNIIKSEFAKLGKYFNGIQRSAETEYLFVLETDFDTFLDFYNNTDFVINHEDLKIVLLNGNRYLNTEPNQLEINLVENCNLALDTLKSVYNKDLEKRKSKYEQVLKSRLELYDWFCGCSQIRYMIKVKESDLNNFEFDESLNQVLVLSLIWSKLRSMINTVKKLI